MIMRRILSILIAAIPLLCWGQITVNTNFEVNTAAPIDTRDTLLNLSDTSAVAFPNPGHLVWVQSLDEHWYYKPTTASWKKFEVTGGTNFDIQFNEDTITVIRDTDTTHYFLNQTRESSKMIFQDGQIIFVPEGNFLNADTARITRVAAATSDTFDFSRGNIYQYDLQGDSNHVVTFDNLLNNTVYYLDISDNGGGFQLPNSMKAPFGDQSCPFYDISEGNFAATFYVDGDAQKVLSYIPSSISTETPIDTGNSYYLDALTYAQNNSIGLPCKYTQDAHSDFMNDLHDTTLAKMDLLYIYLGDSPGGAFSLINLVDTTQDVATAEGNIIWNPLLGWVPQDGTGYIDSNWDASADATHFQRDSASYGFYVPQTDAPGREFYMGRQSSSRVEKTGGGNNVKFIVNGGETSAIAITPGASYFHFQRNDASTVELYQNGTSVTTQSTTSAAPAGGDWYVHALNNGSAVDPIQHSMYVFYVATEFTATEVSRINAAINDLIQKLN